MTMQPEAFTTIRVSLEMDGDAIVVRPRDAAGTAVFRDILEGAPESYIVHSGGVESNDGHHIIGAYINFGGEQYKHTEGRMSGFEYADAIKVHVDLSDSSEDLVTKLRLYLYCGVVLDQSVAPTVEALRFLPAPLCKICHITPLQRQSDIDKKVCKYCARERVAAQQ